MALDLVERELGRIFSPETGHDLVTFSPGPDDGAEGAKERPHVKGRRAPRRSVYNELISGCSVLLPSERELFAARPTRQNWSWLSIWESKSKALASLPCTSVLSQSRMLSRDRMPNSYRERSKNLWQSYGGDGSAILCKHTPILPFVLTLRILGLASKAQLPYVSRQSGRSAAW